MNEKHTLRSLAAQALSALVEERLKRPMLDSEELFQEHAPELWSQYREGIITPSEALLKLIDKLQEEETETEREVYLRRAETLFHPPRQ